MATNSKKLLNLQQYILLLLTIGVAGPKIGPMLNRNFVAVKVMHAVVRSEDNRPVWPGQSVEIKAAQDQAQQLVNTTPGDMHAHYLLGLISMKADEQTTAADAFARALELGVDRYLGYQQLGRVHQMEQEPRLAVAAWQASGDLRPALAWGRELSQPGKTELARAVFEAMAEMADDAYYRHVGYYHLSIAWGIDGRWDLALVELEQAYRIRPDHPATLVDLARALYHTGGDRVRAEALIARAVELEPESEWIATVLVDMYATVGKPEQAARWIRQLERLRAQTIPRERQ